MSEHPVPPAALARLRQSLAAFQQLGQITADAMGLPPDQLFTLDIERGVFISQDTIPTPKNGQVLEHV